MESNSIQPLSKKKLWNILRAVIFMLRKGLNKTKITGKAIANLIEFHHGSAFSCQTIDIANSYISTRDYEFSCCSNSPGFPTTYPFRYFNNKLRKQQQQQQNRHHYFPKSYRYDDFSSVVTARYQRSEASPLVSPLVVRQLRVTDSPFSLKDDGVDSQVVDKAAEEFIMKFYMDLRLERSLAAFESPYRNTLCR